MARMAAENVVAALRGRRPPNLVNPEIWPDGAGEPAVELEIRLENVTSVRRFFSESFKANDLVECRARVAWACSSFN